jgi:hypothetical protein
MKHLLSIVDVGLDNLHKLVKQSLRISSQRNGPRRPLAGKWLASTFDARQPARELHLPSEHYD